MVNEAKLSPLSPTPRSTLRRHRDRAQLDRDALYALLDQAAIARDKLGEIFAAKGVDPADDEACRALLADSADAAFYHNKVQAAVHFSYRALPGASAQAVAILAGEKAPMEAVF